MFIFVSKLNVKFSILENVWSKPLNSQQLPNHPSSSDTVLCYVIAAKCCFSNEKA